MKDVTDKLLRDGIDKFVEPFDKLVAGIEAVREGIVTGRPPTIRSSIPDDLEPAIIDLIAKAKSESVAQKVWSKDESLWGGPGVPEIGDRLGWLTISDKMLEHIAGLTSFAESCSGFSDVESIQRNGTAIVAAAA